MLKAGTLGALAPFLLNGAVKAEVFLLPPSPADHSPPTGYKGRLFAKPIFVAQANPSVVAQVAPRDGQPSNPTVVRPYGIDAAGQISDLELQRRNNNQQLNKGLEDHNRSQDAKLQEILDRSKK
jgi:hypothetical protein